MIAAPTNALFQRLCRTLERPDLASDPRYAHNPDRVRHREPLLSALEAATRRHPTADLMARLRAADVTCAPLQTLDQVAADPQTKASDMLMPTPRAAIPDLLTVALPFRWASGERPGPRRAPPAVGEHTEEVLREAGLDPAAIADLRASGALGDGSVG
jgi:crotonobetainyl-CoA:carnitine CoA-transferase CaiB-like acyl-CoA transferase